MAHRLLKSKLMNWFFKDFFPLKFIYSEKATKSYEIIPLLLAVCTVVESKRKISQNFVVFLEYMNFINCFQMKLYSYLLIGKLFDTWSFFTWLVWYLESCRNKLEKNIYLHTLLLKSACILRRPQNFAKSPPYFWLALHKTKIRWRFQLH